MVSSRDEEIQIRILKASLRQSDRKVSVMDRENERLVEFMKSKASKAQENRKLIEALEIRDVEKTKTIRQLKKRIRTRARPP